MWATSCSRGGPHVVHEPGVGRERTTCVTYVRSMTLAAVAAAIVTIGGCAPKPIGLRPVDTGAGTLAAARKYLEGRWGLLSFEVHPPGRDVIQLKGEGTLLFDGFGNLEMEIRTDETTGQALSEAGIPLQKGRLSVKGRTAVDMAHQTLTFVPQGQPLIVPPSGPLAAIHPRHWTVEGDVLTLGTKDDLGNPTTVGRWRRQAP